MIELPSGARQRKVRGRIFEPSCSDQMAGGNSESEVRRRRGGGREQAGGGGAGAGGGGGQKENLAAREPERKQLQAPDLKVFNLAFSMLEFLHWL